MRLAPLMLCFVYGIAAAHGLIAAQYSVRDLGEGFLPIKLNDVGQIIVERRDPETRRVQSYFLDGGAINPIAYPDAYDVYARGLNNLGQVVGAARDFVGRDHAFLWSGFSGSQSIEPTDVNYSVATDINDLGVVAGSLFGEAALWQTSGEIRRLGHLGGNYSEATALNSNNGVVGISALDPTGHQQHAFVWSQGPMRDLGVVESITKGFQEYAIALDINDGGTIVGLAKAYDEPPSTAAPTDHGFIWNEANGLIELLPDVRLFAINNASQAIGELFVEDPPRGPDVWAAALFAERRLQNLNDHIPLGTGVFLTRALDVNERGQIVAIGWKRAPYSNEKIAHGFLLTPIPEPAAWSLAAIGWMLAGRSRRARRSTHSRTESVNHHPRRLAATWRCHGQS